ncbi:MAG: hypothetical protein QNJ53_04435 [Pleurocapsa sp. MO_192.B19]|nr:hypothetical protein [Pleurocapsa sp. MO_192.B19]
MLFNQDLLFLHVPKTGGMAVTEKLLKTLPKPIYYALPEEAKDKAHNPPEIIATTGKRHGNLKQAQEWVAKYGKTLASFKKIIATIRNPYSMEVSRYFYLRLGYPWDKGKAQKIALASDFETFAIESLYFGRKSAKVEDYFLLDGKIPDNLAVIQHEQLYLELQKVLAELNIILDSPIQKVNSTKHQDYHQYLTPKAEVAIYNRYRWLFDSGFYQRETAFCLNS